MKTFYQNLPIRTKLTVAIMTASFLVLLLFSSIFISVETYNSRRTITEKNAVLADVLGLNSSQPLVLKNRIDARNILSALEAQPHVRAAFLFDDRGKPLAQYVDYNAIDFVRASVEADFAEINLQLFSGVSRQQVSSSWSHIGLFTPISYRGQQVGTIYLLSDMMETYARIANLFLGGTLVLVLLLPIALLLSRILTRPLIQPLLNLSETMYAVSDNGDYSQRVQKLSQDEVGQLVDGFNDMLTQIEIRDSRIADHQKYLEDQVVNRTRKLQETVAELNRAKLSAEEASHAKSQFLANMTHELRTPLIGVLGMNELLARTELTEQQRSLVDTVQRSGENLLALISDILDFSKIEAGYLKLENVEVDLCRLVEETTALLVEKAVAKGLHLTCHVVPEAVWVVRSDPGRIRQILLNLLGNALKFTEAGEVSVRLDMQMVGSGLGRFTLEVSDTGVGISPERQEEVFAAFVQSDSSNTRRHQGTGLGLAIVQQLVSLMDGHIRLDSASGEGCTFAVEVRLPLVRQTLPVLSDSLRGRRILIYQNRESLRQAMTVMLGQLGLVVEQADSPEDIWYRLNAEKRQQYAFDFVILPVELCLPDGSSLPHQLGREASLQPLRVITTGYRCTLQDDSINAHQPLLELPVSWSSLAKVLSRSWQKIELIPSHDTTVTPPQDVIAHVEQGSKTEFSPLKRILLADDNAVTCELIRLSLSGYPLRVDLASTGQEALDVLAHDDFDLVLMDCNMPELDGIDATRQLRQRGNETPVVALTAHVDGRIFEKFTDAGMNDSLRKPFRQKDLFAVLEKWLGLDLEAIKSTPPEDVEQSGGSS